MNIRKAAESVEDWMRKSWPVVGVSEVGYGDDVARRARNLDEMPESGYQSDDPRVLAKLFHVFVDEEG